MAGARIEIEIQDEEVTALLQRLIARVANPKPALAQIGEYGVVSTRERIVSQNTDPVAAWEPLSPQYLASRRKQRSKGAETVLVLHGHLVGTLAWDADEQAVAWGSNRIYAAAQQFGRPEIGLPARPFLGLTETDKQLVTEIMHRWLSGGGQ